MGNISWTGMTRNSYTPGRTVPIRVLVIHSGCTGQAIGLEHLADTGFTGYGSSADYRASRND